MSRVGPRDAAYVVPCLDGCGKTVLARKNVPIRCVSCWYERRREQDRARTRMPKKRPSGPAAAP